MNSKENTQNINFEVPQEIENDQHWKNKPLIQVRGFILTIPIQIEALIDKVILQILFDNKQEREAYYNRCLKNTIFSKRIDMIELVLRSKGEQEVWKKLSNLLYELKKMRNRVAHDNWQMVTEQKIKFDRIEITGKELKHFRNLYIEALYHLHRLFHKYGGVDQLRRMVKRKD